MTVNLAPVVNRAIASSRPADGGSSDAASGAPRFEEALEGGGARHGPVRDRSETAERGAAMRPLGYGHRYERIPAGDAARELLPQDAGDIVDVEIDPAPADAESTQLVLEMLSGGEASRTPAVDADAADAHAPEAENRARKSAGNGLAPPWRGFHARGDFAPAGQDARPAGSDTPAETADILSSVSPVDAGDGPAVPEQESTPPAAAAAIPALPSQTPARQAGGQPAPAQSAPARAAGEPARQPDALLAGESRPEEPAPNARSRQSIQPAILKNGPAGNGQPGSRGAAADPAAGRVTVLAHSTALPPAPAIAPLPAATVAGLVAAIDADPSWRAAAEAANLPAQRAQNAASATSTLRIQLNPAELGVVTARLSMSGSQLSIEIQADSNDARQRLAGDSEAIVKALRVAGIDVEKVTVQQAPSGSGGGGQQQGAAGRDPFAANQQAQAEAGARERGGRGGAPDQGEGTGHGGGEKAADRAGGGLYI